MGPTSTSDFGDLLRTWRERRRLTQLDLSGLADVSTKHLSHLENSKAEPSREMVLRLAEQLEIPLRERNVLLVAAGYAAVYPERELDAEEMAPVRDAIQQVLDGHEPYPAVAVDRAWDIVSMNRAAMLLAGDVDPAVLAPRPNSYRIALHPDGLARRILNFGELAHHLVSRLRHDARVSADPGLVTLLEEVESYPTVRAARLRPVTDASSVVVVPMRLAHPRGELAMFTTVATFGTPVDVTVEELAIETFFPADAETAARLARLAEAADRSA